MGHYVTDEDRADAAASPMLHENLSGLPPCFIATCEFDPLRDEGEAYAAALKSAGCHVESKRYDGLIHGAANMTGVLDLGRQLVADVSSQLRAALHPSARYLDRHAGDHAALGEPSPAPPAGTDDARR